MEKDTKKDKEKDREQEFYKFLDDVGFRKLAEALIQLVQDSFMAGWLAAGGERPEGWDDVPKNWI